MKTNPQSRQTSAFTFWDLLIVLAMVALAVVCLWMWQGQVLPRRAARINCVNTLKAIGLATRMWANDHNDKFPWQASTNVGGLLELSGSLEAFQCFAVMSNELTSPKILVCQSDQQRTKAATWGSSTAQWIGFTGNSNLSYFVGLNADEGRPQTILSGDRNISTNGSIMTGFLTLAGNSQASWTKDLHKFCGNVVLGDGSAQQINNLQGKTNWTVRLLLP